MGIHGFESSGTDDLSGRRKWSLAFTKRATPSEQKRPVILVGHSYGGVVINEEGNDPKVAGFGLSHGIRTGQRRKRIGSVVIKSAPRVPPAPRACRLRMAYIFLE